MVFYRQCRVKPILNCTFPGLFPASVLSKNPVIGVKLCFGTVDLLILPGTTAFAAVVLPTFQGKTLFATVKKSALQGKTSFTTVKKADFQGKTGFATVNFLIKNYSIY